MNAFPFSCIANYFNLFQVKWKVAKIFQHWNEIASEEIKLKQLFIFISADFVGLERYIGRCYWHLCRRDTTYTGIHGHFHVSITRTITPYICRCLAHLHRLINSVANGCSRSINDAIEATFSTPQIGCYFTTKLRKSAIWNRISIIGKFYKSTVHWTELFFLVPFNFYFIQLIMTNQRHNKLHVFILFDIYMLNKHTNMFIKKTDPGGNRS